MPDAQKLKDYIDKYKLEDELSTAVNMAISQDSEDPFWVISQYLKTLSSKGQEEDEDEDDVHDTIEEGQVIPQMQARGRRNQVIAAAVEVPADWKPPKYEKPDEDKKFLKDTMEGNKLMKNLTPSDRDQLMHAFQAKQFKKGENIIKQGDPGDNFYIVKNGAPAPLAPTVAATRRAGSPLQRGGLCRSCSV